jgi:hypothetical protein
MIAWVMHDDGLTPVEMEASISVPHRFNGKLASFIGPHLLSDLVIRERAV